jgi:tRNA pseudouridine38-40 synthase
MAVGDAEASRRHGVLLTVAYDGTAFHGWASQPQPGARTVADVLRGAILALDPRATTARGTSRTDAGVHAEGQLAAFDATLEIPPRGWVLALNSHLPDDACVRAARVVPVGYNPRFSAKKKRYRYRLLLDRIRDPLWRTRAWRVGWPVDKERLAREALFILGTHDFAAFRSAHDARSVTTRTITRVSVEPEGDPRILGVVIEGESFLYNMVRILVGTLVDVARGRLEEGTIARALHEGAAGLIRRPELRRLAGTTAPAHGLTLEAIDLALPDHAGESWPR